MTRPAAHVARVVGLSAALIVFGNAKSWWDLVVLDTTAAGSLFGVGMGIALVLAILVVTLAVGEDPAALGLGGGDWRCGLRLGVWIGGTVACIGALLILLGSLASSQFGARLVELTPAASVPWDQLLWRAVLLLWVDTVIPEELAFRGALLFTIGCPRPTTCTVAAPYTRMWLQVGSAALQPAVLLSAVVFAGWHIVVVLQDGTSDLPTVAGKLLVIGVGGVLFGALRLVGGNLLAPIVAHWLFNMLAMLTARLAVTF
jgi:membrane protease YdiL (CAAX protease family)